MDNSMDYTDVYGDFQCDLTEGYPTLLYVNFDENKFFIGLNDNLNHDGVDVDEKHYQKICDDFGIKSFADVGHLINQIKRYFGEEGYENCAYQIAREFDVEIE